MVAALTALALALVSAGDASAATTNFCVGNDVSGGCPSGSVAYGSLDTAIDAASSSVATKIYIASGIYTAATVFDLGNKQISLIGVGATKPILTSTSTAADSAVLTTTNSLSSISNIEVTIPASTGMIGINAVAGGQTIKNVAVTGLAAAGSKGIQLDGSYPHVTDSSVSLDGVGGSSSAISLKKADSAELSGLTILNVGTGVSIDGAQNVVLRQLNITAARGVDSTNGSGEVASTLVVIPNGSSPGTAFASNVNAGAERDFALSNCTFVHPGGIGGTGVSSTASAAGSKSLLAVDSSVITGFGLAAATASSSSSGVSGITLTYSRYDGVENGPVTDGTATVGDFSSYGFVSAAGGDYRLALASPLVDAGNPAAPSTDKDLLGNRRVVSRGAGMVRDIGAYEVPNTAPDAQLRIVTSVPSTTSPTEFSAAGSSDYEGDSLTYDWAFDGMPGGTGATVRKTFSSEGPHTVAVTVTDATGTATTVSQQFNVARGYLALKLRSQNATISRKGTFKITMTCPVEAISNCTGSLNFQTAKKVDAKNYTDRPGWSAAASYLKAARYVFSITPGSTRKLEVRTYSTFQNVLAKKKKFQLVGSLVSGTTGNANLTSNRATFTISAPKKGK
ncbi:MAG: PKD domain-containing protein [Solirubrobacterales bacterium]